MEELVLLFKTLSEKNRLRVVAALTEYDELCACQITELLTISSATSSRHLGALIQCGLIKSRKKGRWVYYSLNETNSSFEPVIQWIQAKIQDDEDFQKDKDALIEIIAQEPEDICRKQRGKKC